MWFDILVCENHNWNAAMPGRNLKHPKNWALSKARLHPSYPIAVQLLLQSQSVYINLILGRERSLFSRCMPFIIYHVLGRSILQSNARLSLASLQEYPGRGFSLTLIDIK